MSTQVKSDTILDEAVYLCLLAVTDPNSTANEVMNAGNKQYQDLMVEPVTTFVEHAVNDNYSIQINELERGKATLLTVLIRCIDDPQMAHVHKRLKFIVEKIHYYGSDAVKKRIDDWRHDRIQSAASCHNLQMPRPNLWRHIKDSTQKKRMVTTRARKWIIKTHLV
jgi:hypothetical protein